MGVTGIANDIEHAMCISPQPDNSIYTWTNHTAASSSRYGLEEVG